MSTDDSRPEKGTGTNWFAYEHPGNSTSHLGYDERSQADQAGERLFDLFAEAPVVRELRDHVASLAEHHAALHASVDYMDERLTAVEGLERRVRELEADAEGNEDLRLALHSMLKTVQAIEDSVEELEADAASADRLSELEAELQAERERADELEARLEAIEGVFSSRVVDKERAHTAATKRSPTDVVNLGDVYELVVSDVHADGYDQTAVGRIQGLVVFVDLEGADAVPEEGDVVDVQITDTQDTCAHAVPVSEVRR